MASSSTSISNRYNLRPRPLLAQAGPAATGSMLTLPVEIQNCILEYAVNDALSDKTARSKSRALAFSRISQATRDTVLRLAYEEIHLEEEIGLECKQIICLAKLLHSQPALAQRVQVLSIEQGEHAICCEEEETAVVQTVKLCQPKTFRLNTNIPLYDIVPNVRTERLRRLYLSCYSDVQGDCHNIDYWLVWIGKAANTIEILEIPGHVFVLNDPPANLDLVPFCPNLRALRCTDLAIGGQAIKKDARTPMRDRSLYEAFMVRHASILQCVDISAFQDIEYQTVKELADLPRLAKVEMYYSEHRDTVNPFQYDHDKRLSNQKLWELSGHPTVMILQIRLMDNANIEEFLRVCTLCLQSRSWLPQLREVRMRINAYHSLPQHYKARLGTVDQLYRDFVFLCVQRSIHFTGSFAEYMNMP